MTHNFANFKIVCCFVTDEDSMVLYAFENRAFVAKRINKNSPLWDTAQYIEEHERKSRVAKILGVSAFDVNLVCARLAFSLMMDGESPETMKRLYNLLRPEFEAILSGGHKDICMKFPETRERYMLLHGDLYMRGLVSVNSQEYDALVHKIRIGEIGRYTGNTNKA